MTTDDPFDLDRFVTAQDRDDVLQHAVTELRRSRKTSHWMWFVFPQVAGLGRSATARRYAIASLDEARAYLAHPVLGTRLRQCTALVVESSAADAVLLLGSVDAQKLHSSMTLFAAAADADGLEDDATLFRSVLDRYYDGTPDGTTLDLLRRGSD